MAFDKFIPEVWSARLQGHLDNLHVYSGLLNRDYEGDIRAFGDTVHINQLGDITIRDYDGSDIVGPEELDSNQQTLEVDQAKYFNFQIKDVNNAQSNPKLMDKAMKRASYNINDTIDQYLAGLLTDGVSAANILYDEAHAVVPTAANAYDYLVDMGTVLSENNVPMLGRWVVVPPWFHALLLKDPRFVGNGTGYNKAVLQGGLVGEAAGFQIHLSNNVPVTTGKGYKVVAGTDLAGSFAEQLTELEAYRLEHNFSDGVKGLHVFGAKVLEPKGLAMMVVKKQ